MGRKKGPAVSEYNWNKYQLEIFNHIQNMNDNIVVEAAAGSGKTSTLLKSITLIPETCSKLLVSFNNSIVDELKRKLSGHGSDLTITTLHSLGKMLISQYIGEYRWGPDYYKYRSFVNENVYKMSSIRFFGRGPKATRIRNQFRENVLEYIDKGRQYLCATVNDLDFIEERYGIETLGNEKAIAIAAMEWGMSNLEQFDFTDMLWLPHVLDIKPRRTYDFILADECQDINKAQRMLLLRHRHEGSRMICVGDSNQAIYSFAGSDPDSFDELKKLPNTTSLPLSISYRCAKNIVSYAQELVPSIEPNDDGREGEVVFDVKIDMFKDGDMVMCRNNAPLIHVYSELLRQGKKAYIIGKDVADKLIRNVDATRKDVLNVSCMADGVFTRLYDDMFMERNNLMQEYNIDEKTAMEDPSICDMLDVIFTLETLSEGLTTANELKDKIKSIFAEDNTGEGVILTTVHKAKGLEADRAFIICPSLMPNKNVKKDWERKQEFNLMYVARTRAKNFLGIVEEKDKEEFISNSDRTMKKLKRIEELINMVLMRTTKMVITSRTAMDVITKAKQINLIDPNANNISLERSPRRAGSVAELGEMKRKRKRKL